MTDVLKPDLLKLGSQNTLFVTWREPFFIIGIAGFKDTILYGSSPGIPITHIQFLSEDNVPSQWEVDTTAGRYTRIMT